MVPTRLFQTPVTDTASLALHWGPPQCCCSELSRRKLVAQCMTPAAAAAGTAALLLLSPHIAFAHVALDQLPQVQQQQQQQQQQRTIPGSTAGFDPSAVGQIRGRHSNGLMSVQLCLQACSSTCAWHSFTPANIYMSSYVKLLTIVQHCAQPSSMTLKQTGKANRTCCCASHCHL